jgi:hypothetical protein
MQHALAGRRGSKKEIEEMRRMLRKLKGNFHDKDY